MFCSISNLNIIDVFPELNSFIKKMDERYKKKLGGNTSRYVPREYKEPLDVDPPGNFPQWMLNVPEEFDEEHLTNELSENVCLDFSETNYCDRMYTFETLC